jgi:hypothetical protein
MPNMAFGDVLRGFGRNQNIAALNAWRGETRPRYGVGFEHEWPPWLFLASCYAGGYENSVKSHQNTSTRDALL